MGNNNTDDGDGEDGMTSPDFESGHSRHSGKGSRYNDLIALGAKSLWFQQPSLDRVTAAILSPGLQWIPSLISQVTSCEVSATHSSSSFSPGRTSSSAFLSSSSPPFQSTLHFTSTVSFPLRVPTAYIVKCDPAGITRTGVNPHPAQSRPGRH